MRPSLDDLGKPGQPGLILYDGVCVLCSGWFKFVARRDAGRKFYFTTIQSAFGRALAQRLGIDPDNPQTNAVLLDGGVYVRSDSALAALSALPGWRWISILKLISKPFRDAIYTQIARNRYNWFGKNEVCDLGGADFADRIVGEATPPASRS
jgi:predicted DCC family thiol-disulfide oxidoreductase YuxK